MKKRATWLNILVILLSTVFLCGCSTLTYTGEDFDKANVSSISTDEALYFSTYKKSIQEGLNVSTGITKSPLPAILVLYIGVDNKTADDFQIELSDIKIKANDNAANIISPAEFINTYISISNESMASAQAIATTVNSFASIANNYQGGNNQNQALNNQNNAEASVNHLTTFTNGIRAHMLNSSSVVRANESKYYYMFIEEDEYPLVIDFKTLQFTFNSKN